LNEWSEEIELDMDIETLKNNYVVKTISEEEIEEMIFSKRRDLAILESAKNNHDS